MKKKFISILSLILIVILSSSIVLMSCGKKKNNDNVNEYIKQYSQKISSVDKKDVKNFNGLKLYTEIKTILNPNGLAVYVDFIPNKEASEFYKKQEEYKQLKEELEKIKNRPESEKSFKLNGQYIDDSFVEKILEYPVFDLLVVIEGGVNSYAVKYSKSEIKDNKVYFVDKQAVIKGQSVKEELKKLNSEYVIVQMNANKDKTLLSTETEVNISSLETVLAPFEEANVTISTVLALMTQDFTELNFDDKVILSKENGNIKLNVKNLADVSISVKDITSNKTNEKNSLKIGVTSDKDGKKLFTGIMLDCIYNKDSKSLDFNFITQVANENAFESILKVQIS